MKPRDRRLIAEGAPWAGHTRDDRISVDGRQVVGAAAEANSLFDYKMGELVADALAREANRIAREVRRERKERRHK